MEAINHQVKQLFDQAVHPAPKTDDSSEHATLTLGLLFAMVVLTVVAAMVMVIFTQFNARLHTRKMAKAAE